MGPMMVKKCLNVLLLSLFLASPVLALNATLLNLCKSSLYTCVETLNTTLSGGDYSNCTMPFDTCLGEVLKVHPPWPQECFQAEAAWDNCWISACGFLGVLAFNNIVMPAAFKSAAWFITKCMRADQVEHPYIRKFGNILGVFFDENRNGEVTATEIINPQAFITFAGLSIPFYYIFIAMDWQAKCDFARAVVKCGIPGFDDDDFCEFYR